VVDAGGRRNRDGDGWVRKDELLDELRPAFGRGDRAGEVIVYNILDLAILATENSSLRTGTEYSYRYRLG
jgi:hypothetical protein